VMEHIEPESSMLEPASSTLARGRGNRAALVVALSRALGVEAELVLGRSPVNDPPGGGVVLQELDDFSEPLVRFPGVGPGGISRFVDVRLKRAPFGYLPPAIDGAACLLFGSGALERAQSAVPDRRSVKLDARLAEDGSAEVTVDETLTGWPAVEWGDVAERAGEDERKLRREFEQWWLGQQFPGARLRDLAIDMPDKGASGARVHYSFTSTQMVVSDGDERKLAPTFFRAQPGRRFATEQKRRTGLLVGVDVPLDLEASIELPAGARVLELGAGGGVTAGKGGEIRFVEQREQVAGQNPPRLVLRRQARLPILRVLPADYEAVASQLRRVDPLEQAEIRFAIPAGAAKGSAARSPR
jgi:hypothetical protein